MKHGDKGENIKNWHIFMVMYTRICVCATSKTKILEWNLEYLYYYVRNATTTTFYFKECMYLEARHIVH